jgi:hypothetical protein
MQIPFETVTKADSLFFDSRWYAPLYIRKIMYKSLRLKKNQTCGFVDIDKVENDIIYKLRKFYNRRGMLLTQRRKYDGLMHFTSVVDAIING